MTATLTASIEVDAATRGDAKRAAIDVPLEDWIAGISAGPTVDSACYLGEVEPAKERAP